MWCSGRDALVRVLMCSCFRVLVGSCARVRVRIHDGIRVRVNPALTTAVALALGSDPVFCRAGYYSAARVRGEWSLLQ